MRFLLWKFVSSHFGDRGKPVHLAVLPRIAAVYMVTLVQGKEFPNSAQYAHHYAVILGIWNYPRVIHSQRYSDPRI